MYVLLFSLFSLMYAYSTLKVVTSYVHLFIYPNILNSQLSCCIARSMLHLTRIVTSYACSVVIVVMYLTLELW